MRIRFAIILFLLLAVVAGWVVLRRPSAALEVSTAAGDLEGELEALQKKLQAVQPRGTFILIDTARNRLFLKKGDEVLLETVCSTGSGRQLVGPERSWTFKTPKGIFKVQNKVSKPVWRKPDWAFLEEGEPIPEQESERFEKGVLGDYALGIGDGYFIHGTLYTRMLGQNVTHGCVRLGDEDLEFLSRRVPIGTPVFIF